MADVEQRAAPPDGSRTRRRTIAIVVTVLLIVVVGVAFIVRRANEYSCPGFEAGAGSPAVYAVDLASGQRLWRLRTEGLQPGLALDGENILQVSTEGVVSVDRNSGQIGWRSRLPSAYYIPSWRFAAAAHVLLVETVVGDVEYAVALDAADGQELWRRRGGDVSRSVVDDTTVYLGDGTGVIAVRARDGIVRWTSTQKQVSAAGMADYAMEPGRIWSETLSSRAPRTARCNRSTAHPGASCGHGTRPIPESSVLRER